MISNEELLLYVLKYPHLKQLTADQSIQLILNYKEWLVEDMDWLKDQQQTPDTMELFDLYLECLNENEEFIRQQMSGWEDDDVPGFR